MSANLSSRLTPNELSLWLNFIEHQVGFVLPVSQVGWVKGVIERHLSANQMTTTELLAAVNHNAKLYHSLFDDILIPRTQFFRHLPSFELIANYYQHWEVKHSAKDDRFYAWSVGSATGQEAASIALVLWRCKNLKRNFQVYGSDFHQAALRRAQAGLYDNSEASFIPPPYDTQVVLEADGFKLPHIKQYLTYFSLNLAHPTHDIPLLPKQCHVIMCKNVLIYFRQFAQRDIIAYLREYLSDDGILIIGAGELLPFIHREFYRLPIPTVNAYCNLEAAMWVKQLKNNEHESAPY